jgi:hypothetical protein
MDFEEMSRAMKKANAISQRVYASQDPVEVDYAIVELSADRYVIARAFSLGSLDYQFVCECSSHHEAREIVRALSR